MGFLDRFRRTPRSATLRLGTFGTFQAHSYSYDRISESVYKGNPTGYRCVEAIKNNFCRPNWQTRKPRSTEIVARHSTLDVLNQPNDQTSGTMMQASIAVDKELCGKSFWVRLGPRDQFGDKELTGLKRLPADQVSVVANTDDELIGFVYRDRNGTQIPFTPPEILYLRHPHPERDYDGLAPALVSILGAETDTAAGRFNYDLMANDGAVPGYFVVEDLTPEQFDEWKARWEAGENPGRTRFLSGKAEYHKIGQTNQDLAYDELRKHSQRDILTAFGCPRSVTFDAGDITFANADSEREMFIQQNILPKWTLASDELTLQLGAGEVEIGFDLSKIEELARAERELIERASKLLDRRVIVINEFRELLGKAPVPWGDKPIPGVRPLSMETGGEEELEPRRPEAEDRMVGRQRSIERFFQRQAAVLEKRLSNGKGPRGWWDQTRWDEELGDLLGADEAKRVNEETHQIISQILKSNTKATDSITKIRAYLAQRAKELDYAVA